METKTFLVPNIHCGHCTRTIEMEVSEVSGVVSVQANPETRQVTVSWEKPASWQQIRSLLQEINYPAQESVER